MTQEEKDNKSGWETVGGYPKTLPYQDAWAEVWGDMEQSDRDKFLNLPYFNKDIFKEITGINIDVTDEVDITVEGKTIRISRKNAMAFGLIK